MYDLNWSRLSVNGMFMCGLLTGLGLPSSSQVVCVKESAKQTSEEKLYGMCHWSVCGRPVIVEPVV